MCGHLCNLIHVLFGSQAPSLSGSQTLNPSGSQTTPADSGTGEEGPKLQRRGALRPDGSTRNRTAVKNEAIAEERMIMGRGGGGREERGEVS